jgi:hypothetical protein
MNDTPSSAKAWAPGSFEQAAGRQIRGRLVHAQRARKLRRRGELVRHAGYNDNGRAMFRWVKPCPITSFYTDRANGHHAAKAP